MSSPERPRKDADHRDAELRDIRRLSTGLVVGAVGATVVLGVGIAWNDQQRVDQAQAREAGAVVPSTAAPIASSTPAPTESAAPTESLATREATPAQSSTSPATPAPAAVQRPQSSPTATTTTTKTKKTKSKSGGS